MARRLLVCVVCACCLTACGPARHGEPRIEAYFSPNGGCTDEVVREIDKARKSILVQAYSFTSAPIARALAAAHKRRVDVRVILDEAQVTENYSSADFLRHAGVRTFVDGRHAVAHNKVMVIDGETVLTGSFNFTRAAESNNAENLLVIRDQDLAAKYAANWRAHAEHSEPYVRKAARHEKRGKQLPPAGRDFKISQGGSSKPIVWRGVGGGNSLC